MTIELLDIKLDNDGNGISILRRQSANVGGVNYYSSPERQSFRKFNINDVGETVLNTNFSMELDLFTGVENFLTTFYNFTV